MREVQDEAFPEFVKASLTPVDDFVAAANAKLRRLRGYDANAVSRETWLNTGRETLTQQQFAEDADINTIVRRFGLTGSDARQVREGIYGDFSGISDYESAVEAIQRAQENFMRLNPEVRERFGNDPGALIRFANELGEDELAREVGFLDDGLVGPSDPPVPAAPAVPEAPAAPQV